MKRTAVIPLFCALVALASLALTPPSRAAASPTPAAKTPTPPHVAMGQPVKLADLMVPGKIMVFDFYSQYCGPCVQVAPFLEKLHRSRDDIVVVKVDINRPGTKGIDWSSPVAQQYRLQSIPHFKVYGPTGKLMAEDSTRDAPARQLVMGWVQQLK